MGVKKVEIQASMGKGFRVDCKAGSHTFSVDQPAAMGGTDTGPTPLEYLFGALAGCFCAVARIIAAQRRIDLKEIEIKIEGELDTDGLLGKSPDVRTGFNNIQISAKLDADLSQEEKQKFLHEVELRCPVSDNISNSTPVGVKLIPEA